MRKKNIKKTAYLLLALIVTASSVFTFQSCSNEDDSDLKATEEFVNPYNFVGQYHNDGLSYVIENYSKRIDSRSLKAKNYNKVNQANDINKNIMELTNEFCQKNKLNNVSIEQMNSNFKKEISNRFGIKSQNGICKVQSTDSIQQFSKEQLVYIDKFKETLKLLKNHTVSEVQNKLNEIEWSINNSNLSEKDKEMLLVAYAVGRYSLNFWSNYLEKNPKIIKPQKTKRFKIDTYSPEESINFLGWWQQYVVPELERLCVTDFEGAGLGALQGLIFGGGVGTLVPVAGTVTVGITAAVVGAAQGAVFSSGILGITIIYQVVKR